MMQLLPNCMVVAYDIAVAAGIADLPSKNDSRILQKDSNFACSTLTVSNVHNKPTKDQAVQNDRA